MNNRFQGEIDEEIERLAKSCHCTKENLEYMVIVRENGFTVITAEGFMKLKAREKNKLMRHA